jgi:hypothetical protein
MRNVKLRSRRERQLRDNVKKVGIWVFLILFVASIVGVALVAITH